MPPKLRTYGSGRASGLRPPRTDDATWNALVTGPNESIPGASDTGLDEINIQSSQVIERKDFDEGKEPEKILDWRSADEMAPIEYLVHWRGTSEDEASWQCIEFIPRADELLEAFISKRPEVPLGSQNAAIADHVPANIQDRFIDGALAYTALMQLDNVPPMEDDPHVDWRQVESEQTDDEVDEGGPVDHPGPVEDRKGPDNDEEDVAAEPEEISDSESDETIPNASTKLDLKAMYSHRDKKFTPAINFKLSRRYSSFITDLCTETANVQAIVHTMEGVVYCCTLLQNKAICDALKSDDPNMVASSLIIEIWLTVCYRIHNHKRPLKGMYLGQTCGALFLSALEAVGYDKRLQGFLKFWEDRLYDVDGHWMRKKWLNETPSSLASTQLPCLDEKAMEYLTELDEFGLTALAEKIIEKECMGPKTPLRRMLQHPATAKLVTRELLQMLASMDDALLRSCIRRRIPQDSKRDFEDVALALENNEFANPDQPAIYVNFICDRAGMAPSPAAWTTICQVIRSYLRGGDESDELAAEIDQTIRPTSAWPVSLAKKGIRRYPEWRKWTEHRLYDKDPGRRGMISYFILRMEARIKLEEVEKRTGVPFASAVCEIGYAKNVQRRLKEHASHTNSNYIMNLMHAAFENEFPGLFVLQQHVLFRCYGPFQPWVGEIAFTQLCQGYTELARGFSHYPAGYSNGSAFRRTPMKDWMSFLEKANSSGVSNALLKRLKKEQDNVNLQLKKVQEEAQAVMDRNLELDAKIEQLDAAIEHLESLKEQLTMLSEMQDLALESIEEAQAARDGSVSQDGSEEMNDEHMEEP